MKWNKSTGGKKIIEMWSNRQWQMGWSDGQWLMRGEEFGGCVLMTSSLLLERRLSSFLFLHRRVTAVILWHFKLYTLEAQIQLAQGTCHSLLVVFQLGEGFFPQKCWVCRVRETNTKWLKVMDKGTNRHLYLYKGKSCVTVFLWIFFAPEMDQSSSGKHLRTLQGPGVIEDVTYELKTMATCHTDARWSSKLEEMGFRHIWTPQHRLNGLLCWVLQWENAKKLWNDCVTSLLLLAYNCLTAWKLKAPTASDINGLEKPRISYLTTVCPRSCSSRVCNTLTTESGNSTEVFSNDLHSISNAM